MSGQLRSLRIRAQWRRRLASLNWERRETPTRCDRKEKSEQNWSPCSILYIWPPVTKVNLMGGFLSDLGRTGVSRPRGPGVIPFPNPPRRGPNRALGFLLSLFGGLDRPAGGPLRVLCHEQSRSTWRCVTVREMKVGRSRSAIRC